MKSDTRNRRWFFKTCLSTVGMVATNPTILAQSDAVAKRYSKALLQHENGQPITSKSFVGTSHLIFYYPFITTPCFLIKLEFAPAHAQRLKTENDNTYQWPGGVGPNNSVVGFSAICAHKLSYTTRTTSFLNYRPEEISYIDSEENTKKQKQLIYCCSERSVYDPTKGSKVVGGPAKQPLTTIIIEYDFENDHYYATATLGGELYDQFFEKFGFRLALDNKIKDIQAQVEEFTIAYSAEAYTKHQMQC